ncbi:MAG: hypothetical protein JO051_15315 [Acidobacteriaceae bacterium]|nr:hypothetical protein [Acidobacteriaceae bacterium]
MFPCKEASGYGLFGFFLGLLTVCEGIPLHFLLWRRHPVAGMLLLIANFAALWLVMAMVRAGRSGAILVDDEFVRLRIGSIWQADIPRRDIASCRRVTPGAAIAKSRTYLKAVVLNDPQYLIELSRPTIAKGLYGVRREVTLVGIAVHDREAFAAVLGC